jgi:hypothetical protein
MTYFHKATPIAAIPIAPLFTSEHSAVSETPENVPWVSAIELLAEIRNQQSEGLQDMILFV